MVYLSKANIKVSKELSVCVHKKIDFLNIYGYTIFKGKEAANGDGK